jgi:hypothetical protein
VRASTEGGTLETASCNRTKETLEALVRALPERSMRLQVRYEVTEGHGDLTERYVREQRIDKPPSRTSAFWFLTARS